jgi:hypothetical protein
VFFAVVEVEIVVGGVAAQADDLIRHQGVLTWLDGRKGLAVEGLVAS